MRMFSKIKKVFRLFRKKDDAVLLCPCTTELVIYYESGKILKLKWSDVIEIAAFKLDQLTSDLLCLEFKDKQGKYWPIHEEIEGFIEVEKYIGAKFNLIEPNWRAKVVKPAFERNYTVIFK